MSANVKIDFLPAPAYSDDCTSKALQKKNEAIHFLNMELGKKKIDTYNIVQLAKNAAIAESQFITILLGHNDFDIAVNAQSLETCALIASEWLAFAKLTQRDVVDKIKVLAKGENKIDKAHINEIAKFVGQGKFKDAMMSFKCMDTFVRDAFPDDVVHWLWFNSGRKTDGIGRYPAGIRTPFLGFTDKLPID